MSFGSMPIANSFIEKSQAKNQFFYDMEVAFCQSCFTFQILNVPNPNLMFNENYAYYIPLQVCRVEVLRSDMFGSDCYAHSSASDDTLGIFRCIDWVSFYSKGLGWRCYVFLFC